MEYENYEISEQNSGKTVYIFLKNQGFSERYIKHLRVKSNLLIDDEPATMRTILTAGNILKVAKNIKNRTEIFCCDSPLDIVFEDSDYLFVNKPSNLACMPTKSHYQNNLGGQICSYMQQKDENFVLRVLNRLDRETAGIVAVAKNIVAYKNAKINKEYHAICHGTILEELTIDKPIQTICIDGKNQQKRVVSTLGKPAITHVRPLYAGTLKNCEPFTLVRLVLETGRTHQIRVHMAAISHPLFYDQIYGIDSPKVSYIPEQNGPHALLILKKVSFTHFRTKEDITLEVPYPADFLPFIK